MGVPFLMTYIIIGIYEVLASSPVYIKGLEQKYQHCLFAQTYFMIIFFVNLCSTTMADSLGQIAQFLTFL